MSGLYPPTVCALIFVGNITGLEVYLNIVLSILVFASLVLCPSVRPLITPLCAYVCQVSLFHTPWYPTFSDYYYTGWRLPMIISSFSLILIGLFTFIFRNKIYRRLSFKNTPLLKSLLLLCAAFLLSGAFSSRWSIRNLGFAAAVSISYALVFLLIYCGIPECEKAEPLADYFSFVSLCIAMLISAELLFLFFTSDRVIVNGSIVKDAVALGWGIWNLIGASLTVLIPLLFYGVARGKHPFGYFLAATLSYAAAVLTMSRNTLLFSTLAYVGCIITLSLVGKYKKAFRVLIAVGIVATAALAVLFYDKIARLLSDYLNRGFSDNGRFALWQKAFDNFISAPFFGVGFYGIDADTAIFGPLPIQAHNTVFQLLSASGILGLFSYIYYRVQTVRPFLRHPTFIKGMLGASALLLVLMSLFDNFIFNIYPMFYYNVALAIAFKCDSEASENK